MAKSRIAEAYVQLVPTATGFKEAIAREIDDPIDNSVKTASGKFKALGGFSLVLSPVPQLSTSGKT